MRCAAFTCLSKTYLCILTAGSRAHLPQKLFPACRDPEARPSAVQCLQHPYFQVGVRAPLASKSPVCPASGVSVGVSKAAAFSGQAAAIPRRASRDAANFAKQTLAGIPHSLQHVNSGAHRDSTGAAGDRDGQVLLPSLSIGNTGPRAARYKPGVSPADVGKSSADSSAKRQSGGPMLPQVKNPLSRVASGTSRPAGGLEARYGLGRRY